MNVFYNLLLFLIFCKCTNVGATTPRPNVWYTQINILKVNWYIYLCIRRYNAKHGKFHPVKFQKLHKIQLLHTGSKKTYRLFIEAMPKRRHRAKCLLPETRKFFCDFPDKSERKCRKPWWSFRKSYVKL